MRVSLFITCFNDTIFPATGRAVVQILERLGHSVDFDPNQTCCGQMHFNTGYQREAIPLVRRFVEMFRDSEAVVSPSASCVGMARRGAAAEGLCCGDRAEEIGVAHTRVDPSTSRRRLSRKGSLPGTP